MSNIEPTYEPLDEDVIRKPKKLFGTTELQRKLLAVSRRKSFNDNDERDAFVAFEEFAAGEDEESRCWRAWIIHRLDEAAVFNKKMPVISLVKILDRIGDDEKRNVWIAENRKDILKKPVIQNIANVKPASSLPPKPYVKTSTDEVDDLISKLEALLGVNVINTVKNRENARKILDDGRSLDEWWEWFQKDNWRIEHKHIYANLQKIWELWPQAWDANSSNMNPHGLDQS